MNLDVSSAKQRNGLLIVKDALQGEHKMKCVITVPFTGVKEFHNSDFGMRFSNFMRWYNFKMEFIESDDTINIDEVLKET